MLKPMENKESGLPESVITERSLKKKTVFLFKSPKENEVDKFAESLEKIDMECVTIPVLSFRFINQSALRNYLSAIHLYSAIIFTSVRAVEAVISIAKELENERNILHTQSFVVGNTTAKIAKESGFSPKGENCGNSKALAEFILNEVAAEIKPLLYPCSNLHHDTLQDFLTSHGLQVTEVVSYETCPNENMKEAIEKALHIQGLPDYAVFFSPSGIKYTQAVVDNGLFQLDKVKLCVKIPIFVKTMKLLQRSCVKIIALGPSTYKCLCDSGFTPFGMAEKPEPQSLIQLLS